MHICHISNQSTQPWTPHSLHSLVNQGFMMATELVACHSTRGPHVPHTGGRTCGDLCSIVRVGIRCAIAPVPPLIVASLLPRAAQSNPLEGPTHCGLCDFVRGLQKETLSFAACLSLFKIGDTPVFVTKARHVFC
jgi:hypothetical protein